VPSLFSECLLVVSTVPVSEKNVSFFRKGNVCLFMYLRYMAKFKSGVLASHAYGKACLKSEMHC
jgi:hypothetical protein